jgi:hypothetical protein
VHAADRQTGHQQGGKASASPDTGTRTARNKKTSHLVTGCAYARAIKQRELHASLTNGN